MTFNFAVRFLAAACIAWSAPALSSTPYTGTPVAVPGTLQAENFDRGGEGDGYHDTVAGNVGGYYRPGENVDILASTDTLGGAYDIVHFVTGEWLKYTINVPRSGEYTIELRAATHRDFPNSAFHVEVDGNVVTGSVVLPDTGGWSSYQWVGRASISLTQGTHQLKLVSDRPYFGLNAIRVLQAPASTPYSGAPIALPATFQAEDFDRGGEGVAYHDTVAGNSGGRYRTADAVDIVASADSSGGAYDIIHFVAGEWLKYTISVPRSGDYTLELRAATHRAFPSSAFHVEVDGQAVTGSVVLPDTGGWNNYAWLGQTTLSLTQGTHVLKLISDRPYFALNAIRISDPGSSSSSSAQPLFRSGFEGTTTLLPLVDCWGTGCWQELIGLDSLTNFSWPPRIWGGGGKFLLLTDPVTTTALNIGNRMFNRIETVSGPRGTQTRALLQQISQNVNGTGPMGTSSEQTEFQLLPKQELGDLYLSYWLKLQPDLVQKMATDYWGNNGTWRAIFAFKTGGQTAWGGPANNGDYRVEAYVRSSNGQLFWSMLGDNNAGGGAPLINNWNIENRNVPVPVGQWFKLEFFWHRSSGSDGRVWMAVNGQVIADRRGPNMGAWNLPINRIMAPLLYSGGAMPIYQWFDDLEIWDGFPPSNSNNPPYATH